MSRENVEVVRRTFDAWARRDVDAALRHMDPGVELRSAIIGGAEGTVYRGHAGVRAWLADSEATFDELRVEPDEFRIVGPNDVLLLGRLHARGRESGVSLDSPLAWVCTVRAGKIVSQRGFLHAEDALKAVGLSE